MKLASLEIMFCKDVYELLVWFKQARGLRIPSREDFSTLMEMHEIQTMGIWFDHVGLISVLKINNDAKTATWGFKQLSIPVCSDDLVKINNGLKSASEELPPKITLWLKPDFGGARLTEIEGYLASIGFVKDFANNWDLTGDPLLQ